MSAQQSTNPLQNYLGMPEVQALLQDIAFPEGDVQQWLASLLLLNNIPFQNIIPDTRLVRAESLKFFYLDPSWIDALMDGALSVGSDTSLDMMFTEVMAGVVKAGGAAVAAQIRQALLNIEPENTPGTLPDPNNLMAGLMFRSAIVSDWPGMHIIATLTDGTVLKPLRFEKIGADIILIIYNAIPDNLVIQQPSQALTFGVMDGKTTATYDIYLRSIGYGSYTNTGAAIEDKNNDPIPVVFPATGAGLFRADNNYNVLDINNILSKLQTGLQNINALSGNLSPAEFALQLAKTPEEAPFTNTISTK